MAHPLRAQDLADALHAFQDASEPEQEGRHLSEVENILQNTPSPDRLLQECFRIMQKGDPVEAIESLQYLLSKYEFGEDVEHGRSAILMALPIVGNIQEVERFCEETPPEILTGILREFGRIPQRSTIHWFPGALLRADQANDWLLETRRSLITAALMGTALPAAAIGTASAIPAKGINIGSRLLVGCVLTTTADLEAESDNPALIGADAYTMMEDADEATSPHDHALIDLRHTRLEGERDALHGLSEGLGMDSVVFGPAETLGMGLVEAACVHLQYLHGIEMQMHNLSASQIAQIYQESEVHVYGNFETSRLVAGVLHGSSFYGPYETLLPWKFLHMSDLLEKMAETGILASTGSPAVVHDKEDLFWQALRGHGKRRLH